MKITCIDKDINEVLGTGFYQIPRFQRPYLWEREQVEAFWEDTVANEESDYFIGSMVVYSSASNTFGVVDGQQRLTTLTMILCALRNALSTENERDLAKGLQNRIERPDINNQLQFVLQNESPYPFFQECIQKFGVPDADGVEIGEEERRLQEAFDILRSLISDCVKSVRIDASIPVTKRQARVRKTLTDIRDRILRLKVIVVALDDPDDAYLIFETLNTRGKDLSVSDLVKNHLTRLIKPTNAKVDRTIDRWNQLVEILEESEADLRLNSFLHHLWLSEYAYTTEKKLFKEIRAAVKKPNAYEFLMTLLNEATTYREIHETSYRKWKKSELGIKTSLEAFSIFRVKQQLPMVMAVMRDYRNGKLQQKHVERMLRAIECFHFKFTAITSQRSSGGISLMYAMHARQLLGAKDLTAKLKCFNELKAKLEERQPSYQEFEATFLEIRYTSKQTKQKKLVQYILSCIGRFQAKGVALDHERMTVEHLAPENPSSKGAVSENCVGCLGNLILIDGETNNKLANKEFDAKRQILLMTHVPLDDHIRNAKEWNDAEIKNLTRKLAKLAYEKVWRL